MGKKVKTFVLFQDEIRDEYLELIRDAVSRGTPFTFKAHGSSMFPLIPGGTEVTVERFGNFPPAVGTICVGIKNGRLFCHRLVEVKTGGGGRRCYILRGDNHRAHDEPFNKEELVGEVTALRCGPVSLSSSFPPFKLAGKLWMHFPGPAIFTTRLVWKITRPARFVSKKLLGLLDLTGHGDKDH